MDWKGKKKIFNFNLDEGYYNVSVELNIESFLDINPGDNMASREIFVSCQDS